jgi:hypothetical protein
MSKIPKKILAEILADPYYKVCARKEDGSCNGRITFEHALIFAGKQVQEKFAIIPLCTYHHAVDMHQDGGQLDKDRNVQIALNRATEIELRAISKVINYVSLRDRLNTIYG